MREALFDILGERVRGAVVLEIFAGSGAIGIEALSRGAARVVFIECGREALRVLERNIENLGVNSRAAIVRVPWPAAVRVVGPSNDSLASGGASGEGLVAFVGDPEGSTRALEAGPTPTGGLAEPVGSVPSGRAEVLGGFDIVFADPPYKEARYEQILASLSAPGILRADGVVVVEHESRTPMPVRTGSLELTRVCRYGRSALGFYAAGEGLP